MAINVKTAKIRGPSSEKWHMFRTNVYNARIYMFVGDRQEMCRTAYDAFSSGCDPMEIWQAKAMSERLSDGFGHDRAGINGECVSVQDDAGMRIWVVRMNVFSGSVDDTVVLSHECLHAALSIMGDCGVSENPPFEALCYLHEAIFENLIMFCFGRIGQLRYGPEKEKRRSDG